MCHHGRNCWFVHDDTDNEQKRARIIRNEKEEKYRQAYVVPASIEQTAKGCCNACQGIDCVIPDCQYADWGS